MSHGICSRSVSSAKAASSHGLPTRSFERSSTGSRLSRRQKSIKVTHLDVLAGVVPRSRVGDPHVEGASK